MKIKGKRKKMKEEVEKKKDTLVYFSRESTTRGILC